MVEVARVAVEEVRFMGHNGEERPTRHVNLALDPAKRPTIAVEKAAAGGADRDHLQHRHRDP